MMLIEGDKRKEKIKLAYRNEYFGVPENVYLIGMMNTADRSLALMDYALRRRFSFYEVTPAFKRASFVAHMSKYISDSTLVTAINDRLAELNDVIADEDSSGLGKGFCIGTAISVFLLVTDRLHSSGMNRLSNMKSPLCLMSTGGTIKARLTTAKSVF
jgi:5-methylcytosine-specific restriction protein B